MLALMGELIGESGTDVEGIMGCTEAVSGAVDGIQREGGEARRAVSLSPFQRIIADNILAAEGAGAAASYLFMLEEASDGTG